MRGMIMAVLLVLAVGCAARQQRFLSFDFIGGDLEIIEIGSDGQEAFNGTEAASVMYGVRYSGRSLWLTHDVIVGSVSGSVRIGRVLSGTQGQR